MEQIIELDKKIGKFSDSAVYKAKWGNRTIAVKEYSDDIISIESLDHEYSQVAKTNHENFLKFFGTSASIVGCSCLLMEYADCGSLHEQIHGMAAKSYSTDTALNWMYQCAKGLAYLHGLFIVHFNIKPRNLLLTKNFRQLKIAELGIHPTKVQECKSLEYMPPERFTMTSDDDWRKYDVFSFGMVFWEVLTRRKPLLEIKLNFAPFLKDLPSDSIRSLIESCWNLNPLERPSMKAVAMKIALEKDDIKLGERMGSGSFGVVYKSQILDAPYAVKKFFIEDADTKEDIEREVTYLSRATNLHIIELYGTMDTKNSGTMILMELAENGTLYDYIHSVGDYCELDAIFWMFQLAKGLQYLHAMKPKPIIHRDIKTKNLLLTRNNRVLKIADFGTATKLATLMTRKYVGTAEYMAPEVGEGYKYTEKSDVYSFGIVFWEVMTKKKPFYHLNNYNPLTIMNLVSKGERPPIEDVKGTEKYIKPMISNCWERNPEKRLPMYDHAECLVCCFHNLLPKRPEFHWQALGNQKRRWFSPLPTLQVLELNGNDIIFRQKSKSHQITQNKGSSARTYFAFGMFLLLLLLSVIIFKCELPHSSQSP